MKKYKKIIIYTDGGSRNNPGPAGVGVVIYDEIGNILETHKECIGKATNNVAEYMALVIALKRAQKFEPDAIDCFLDSELVVKQLTGVYKVKEPGMKELFNQIKDLIFFKNITFTHIRREKNKLADSLVNEALDEAGF